MQLFIDAIRAVSALIQRTRGIRRRSRTMSRPTPTPLFVALTANSRRRG